MKLVAALVVVLALAQAAPPRPATPDIAAAATRYASGDHSPPVAPLPAGRLTTGQLMAGLDAWSTAGDAAKLPQRQIIAATFALEVIWRATRDSWLSMQREGSDPFGRVTPSDPARTSFISPLAPGHIG